MTINIIYDHTNQINKRPKKKKQPPSVLDSCLASLSTPYSRTGPLFYFRSLKA